MFLAFSSREVTLGQMRKIGIHFIIYRFCVKMEFVVGKRKHFAFM